MVQFNQKITEFFEKYYPKGRYDGLCKDWDNLNRFERNILPYLPEELEYKKELQVDVPNCFFYCFNQGIGIKVLLKKKTKEIEAEEISFGDYVIYWKDTGDIAHCGIIEKNGKVRSKWGSFPVFIHNIFDVPYKERKITFHRRIKKISELD